MKVLEAVVVSLFIICAIQVQSINTVKILGFLVTLSRSHLVVEEPIMKELARRGHEVTVVSAYQQSQPPLQNYRYIAIPEFLDHPAFEHFKDSAFKIAETNTSNYGGVFSLMHPITKSTLDTLNHPKFKELKKESFDLVIIGWFMNDFILGLAGHFRCPSVVMFPNINNYMMRKLSGSPNSVSTVPSALFSFRTPMTFVERIKNAFANLAEYAMIEIFYYIYHQPLYEEAFPPEIYPSYDEVLKNVSLVLISQHFTERTPEPLVPGLIEVAGMHIPKEPSPLPTEIKEFLDNATDGAIFMSLGSNVRSSDLSQEKLAAFLNKFRKIKQKVIWKFESDLPNKSDNVMVSKWLPQSDILAHPNLKVFISHCGKGGVTEAKYHGVPVLAVPLFAEQPENAKIIVSEGWAVQVPFADLNEESFSKSLDEILGNPKYGQNAQKLSDLYRDRPEHPLDKAAFWIEYVIRHNGAKHMQSPAINLNFIQYYMLDVMAFIVAIFLIAAKLTKIVFRKLKKIIFGTSKQKTN